MEKEEGEEECREGCCESKEEEERGFSLWGWSSPKILFSLFVSFCGFLWVVVVVVVVVFSAGAVSMGFVA